MSCYVGFTPKICHGVFNSLGENGQAIVTKKFKYQQKERLKETLDFEHIPVIAKKEKTTMTEILLQNHL